MFINLKYFMFSKQTKLVKWVLKVQCDVASFHFRQSEAFPQTAAVVQPRMLVYTPCSINTVATSGLLLA